MIALNGVEVSGMEEAPVIGAIMMEVPSGRRVTSVWTELAPGGYGVTESLGCLDTLCHLVRINF